MRIDVMSGSRQHRARGRLASGAVVGVLATALLTSACSSSTKSAANTTTTSGSAASTAPATGSPINVMTIDTSTGTAAGFNTETGVTAQAYEKWINANGGIAGHPLHVTVCDDGGVASQAATCAREAVSGNDVAVVSSISIQGEPAIVPILQQANIAWFGPIVPGFPADLSSSVSFPLDSVPAQNASEVALALQNGCKKLTGVVLAPSAQVTFPFFSKAAAAYGTSIREVQIPVGATDLSPQVAQAIASGTDCVVTAIGTPQFASFLPPWFQSGTHAVLYDGGGQLPTQGVDGYNPSESGSYNVSLMPDITSSVFSTYRAALASYKASSGLNYDSITGVGAWTGYVAFTNVAKTIQGTITAASFLAAANQDSNVTTGGILPTINFTTPWTNGPAGNQRTFNCGITFQKLENGHFQQVSANWQNANALLEGTGKLGPLLPASSTALACQS